MRRTDRLFEIIQLFRGGGVLLARDIAERLEVSVRTVYRDIDSLIASGIPIEGARGVGYMLRGPVFLPPLTLTLEELRALHLGMTVVAQTCDDALARAADGLLTKVDAVVPERLRHARPMDSIAVYAGKGAVPSPFLPLVRRAVVERLVLEITYDSLAGVRSTRRIHPVQTEFWGRVWLCPAWCELRESFRSFRVDRIVRCELTGTVFAAEPGRGYGDYLVEVMGWQTEGA